MRGIESFFAVSLRSPDQIGLGFEDDQIPDIRIRHDE